MYRALFQSVSRSSGSLAAIASALRRPATTPGGSAHEKTRARAKPRRYQISSLRPVTNPPSAPRLLEKVPRWMSTSSSSPKCSATPRPFEPYTKVECASSIMRRAPCLRHTSRISGRSARSPSIEYTPSTTTSFLPGNPSSLRSRSSGSLCRKKREVAFERIIPSTMLAWASLSATIRSPGRIRPAITPTLALYPEGKTSAASFPLKSAISLSKALCRSIDPERIGDPDAPAPYLRTPSQTASMTSGR